MAAAGPGPAGPARAAWLRNGDTYTRLAAGFGVGTATVYRYLREAVDLLAGTACTLQQVIEAAALLVWVVLDGTLIPIDRVADQRPYFSGKHRRHGINTQVLAGPRGHLLWASPVPPGRTHDLTAARYPRRDRCLTEAKVTTWADRGHQGAGRHSGHAVQAPSRPRTFHQPARGQPGPQHHPSQRRTRHCRLKTWKILTTVRCDPSYTTTILQAITVLQHVEDQHL